MKTINTDKAPKVVGPYSHAIEANGFVFCAGQVGKAPQANELKKGIVEQTKQAIENISAVLQEAGLTLEDVVKTTIFLADVNDFATVNEIYGKHFTSKPARSTVEVSNIPQGALIEIEVIALAKKEEKQGCCGNC